jgi:putative transposase
MREKCKFTPEEKLQILQEAEFEGLSQTLRKHGITSSLFYKWKKAFIVQGIEGLSPQHIRVDPAISSLEKENKRLRKIIADMTLELKKTKEEKEMKEATEVERLGG